LTSKPKRPPHARRLGFPFPALGVSHALTALDFLAALPLSQEQRFGGFPLIVKLPKALADQIAAGEVVVRPASVVKELVENSIDANAARVVVTVANVLRDITVLDDGQGMDRDDALLALERHATSKIRSLEDLQAIATRGFRGEALPSIAAVSRLTLTTRRAGDLAATRVEVEGGRLKDVRTVGAPVGTCVSVRDLFYNTPARLKFLKSPATELGHLTRVAIRQALAVPALGIRLVNQGKLFFDLPAQQPLESRVLQLLGVERENLLPVDFEKYGVRISGFIVKPAESRRDRRHQFFFVNGRPISHRTLSYSVSQAYEGLITTQRYPIVVLDIRLAPDEVDVNVHPTKEEVRFREERKITGLVHRAVAETLRAAELLPRVRLPETSPASGLSKDGEGRAADADFLEQFHRAAATLQVPFPALSGRERASPPSTASRPPPVASSKPEVSPGPQVGGQDDRQEMEESLGPQQGGPPVAPEVRPTSPPEIIGQIADTYILARVGEDLLIVDQHAAHERVLYLRAKERRGRFAAQPLLVPISVEIRPADRPFMEDLLPILSELGFEAEPFGGRTFIVRSVPALFEKVDVPAFIKDLIDDLAREGKARDGERVRENALSRLACRSAIKAGQKLQVEEMRRLLDDLLASDLSYTCPHGRPTMILLTRDQLDRQFKRK